MRDERRKILSTKRERETIIGKISYTLNRESNRKSKFDSSVVCETVV